MGQTAPVDPELTRLGDRLRQLDLRIAVAESMTGGLLAAALADLSQASTRFLGGVVSYTVDKKIDLLGVPETVISKDGVISAATVRLMAEGGPPHLRRRSVDQYHRCGRS